MVPTISRFVFCPLLCSPFCYTALHYQIANTALQLRHIRRQAKRCSPTDLHASLGRPMGLQVQHCRLRDKIGSAVPTLDAESARCHVRQTIIQL